MNLNKEGIDLITSFEKFESKPYQQKGDVPTIGYGNTWYENGTKVKLTDPAITKERATELFKNVVAIFVTQVKSVVKRELNDNQFSALVSYCYNRGFGKFKTSDVLNLVNVNPDDPKIQLAFKDVSMTKPQFQKGILRRRTAESALYFKK